jgi:HAD superfamily hydrolase (TIGR01490 family)
MENPRLTVFDIDGTMLPGTSCERLFFQYLIDQRILSFLNLFHFILRGLFLMPRGRTFALKANKGYLRGMRFDKVAEIGREFFAKQVARRISTVGIERLNEHRGKGERVVLLSGMPEFLLRNFAEFLHVEDYRGSRLEINSGKITGKTIGTFPLSEGKAKIVESLLDEFNVAWGDVTAYGDHYGDRYLLQKVGHPVAVNPDYGLRQLAHEKGWPIETFD